MKYVDFIDLEYEPKETDVICTFYVETEGMKFEKAAGGIAAESSIGTWTELTTVRSYVKELAAKVFHIEGNTVKIAYPLNLFEHANIANILSSVSGNVFGLRGIKNLRLNDIHLPSELIKGFKGPKYGIGEIRELLGVYDRPLVGTIVKPKLGLKTEHHAQVAYEAWAGGCDIVKDDENLSSQKFNPFEDRLVKTLESRDRAEEETGRRKVYMVNVTAETKEMIRRAQKVSKQGGEYIMVDILTCGFSALQTLRREGFDLVIHAHRAGHAAFTKKPKHGISMQVIAKIARLIGVDQLHVGTGVGKMYESKEEVEQNCRALKENMGELKRVFPVASGGLHPGLVPELIRFFGEDVIIQAGGGIHGHRKGTRAGAEAMQQAVEATLEGIPLDEFAESHNELKTAIELWGKS